MPSLLMLCFSTIIAWSSIISLGFAFSLFIYVIVKCKKFLPGIEIVELDREGRPDNVSTRRQQLLTTLKISELRSKLDARLDIPLYPYQRRLDAIGFDRDPDCTIPYNREIKPDLCCPITRMIMNHPITLPSGITFELEQIIYWAYRSLNKNETHFFCPTTHQKISIELLTEIQCSIAIKSSIEEFVFSQELLFLNHTVYRICDTLNDLRQLLHPDFAQHISEQAIISIFSSDIPHDLVSALLKNTEENNRTNSRTNDSHILKATKPVCIANDAGYPILNGHPDYVPSSLALFGRRISSAASLSAPASTTSLCALAAAPIEAVTDSHPRTYLNNSHATAISTQSLPEIRTPSPRYSLDDHFQIFSAVSSRAQTPDIESDSQRAPTPPVGSH